MYARSCPKCDYVRRDTDTAPDWQCPSCRTAYAKASAELAAARRAERAAAQPPPPPEKKPRFKLKLNWAALLRTTGLVVFAGAVAYGAYGKFVLKPAAAPRVAKAEAAARPLPLAMLYTTTTTCPDCQATRELLGKRGIMYVEINVEKQPERQEHLIDRYHVSGFPILEVGEDIVVGFQPAEIDRLIANARHI